MLENAENVVGIWHWELAIYQLPFAIRTKQCLCAEVEIDIDTLAQRLKTSFILSVQHMYTPY